jgi:hypothetical protein
VEPSGQNEWFAKGADLPLHRSAWLVINLQYNSFWIRGEVASRLELNFWQRLQACILPLHSLGIRSGRQKQLQ